MPDTTNRSWEAVREEVRNRDDSECRFCGITDDEHREEHGKGLDVHHVIPRKDGGTDAPQNLATLCRSCHNTLEQLHAEAVADVSRKADYSDDHSGVNRVYNHCRNRAKAYESELGEFFDRHPAFARRFQIVDTSPDGEIPEFDAGKWIKATPRKGDPMISSEWEFAVAWGYKRGLNDMCTDISKVTDVPFEEMIFRRLIGV